MKDYKEMAESVFDKIEKAEQRKKRTEKILFRAALGVSSFVGLLMFGMFLTGSFSFSYNQDRLNRIKTASDAVFDKRDTSEMKVATSDEPSGMQDEWSSESAKAREAAVDSASGKTTAKFAKSIDLTKKGKEKPQPVNEDILEEKSEAYLDFSLDLFRKSAKDNENHLLSPLSVLYALGMTMNGADGNTLSQMEQVTGMSDEELNIFLHTYHRTGLSDKKPDFKLANSIWIKNRDDFKVKKDFIQKSIDFYHSPIFRASFDEGTLKEINQWIADKTDNMVKNVLDRMDRDAVLYLINALCFEAKWEEPYQRNQIRKNADFISYSGERRKVKMMESFASVFLSDKKSTGFMKLYEGGKYGFVAILPNKGVDIKEYVQKMTASDLNKMLTKAENRKVFTNLPSFAYDSEFLLNDPLEDMGIKDAFDGNLADFSRMGSLENGNNIVVNRILHKTHITVDEAGTRAGAATVVEMKETTAVLEEIKEVILDRPFVYMIIDTEENIPIFIGTVMDIGK